jgi:hypothetical protein
MITFAPGPKAYRSNLSMAKSRGLDEMNKAIEANEIPNADYMRIDIRDTFWIQTRCPRCGSVLISNGTDVWCSSAEPACYFGLDSDIPMDALPAAIEHERKQQPDNSGVPVFGHTQVDEAVRLVAGFGPQELRQFAEQLNCANADNANRLIDLLITGGVAPDVERHARIGRMLRSIATVEDDAPVVADEEDYAGDRYQLMDDDERQTFVAQ